MSRKLSAWQKSMYQGMFAERVQDPDAYEYELLRSIEDDGEEEEEDNRTLLAEFRARRAAGLCTMEAYRAEYPHIFEPEEEAQAA